MRLLKLALRLGVLFALTGCSLLCWGQYSIISGEYRDEGFSLGLRTSLSLLVARPSGKNWTVKGTLNWNGKLCPVSGTLYEATHKVSLQVKGFDQGATDAVIDGQFDPETGLIDAEFSAKIRKSEKSLWVYSCKNKNQKPEMETVWVLEAGYPKRCDTFTEEIAKTVTVDPKGGSVTWRNLKRRTGETVDQVINFSVPKNEYRHGEKLQWWLDASGTHPDVVPVLGLHMAIGWDGQGWAFAIDWGRGAYFEAVKGRPTWEPIFGPPKTSRVRVVVRLSPGDLYEWWYAPVSRPKKPVPKPDKTVKPDKTIGSGDPTGKPGDDSAAPGSKAPTLKVVSMKGDVQVRKNSSNEWVDFKDALPLKVGDQISTSFDEEIELALPDGATLRMEPNSTIKVGPLLEPNGQRTQAIMDMIHGRVFVRNITRPGFAGGDMVLRRNEAVWSTRGTKYSLAFDQKEKMAQVHVEEGEVIVAIKGEEPLILKAGETWVRKFAN